jgi:hypothetical protein
MTLFLVGLACLIVGSWLGIALARFHKPIRAWRERIWRLALYGDPREELCAFIRGDRDAR